MKMKNLDRRRGSRGTRLIVWFTLLCFAAVLSLANIELGRLTFAYPPARKLQGAHLGRAPAPATLAAGLSSYGFMSSVGGVAFGGVAKPGAGCQLLGLEYRAGQPDGARLQVRLSVEDKPAAVTAALYDWQLKPIAQFADSRDFACFTLFGKLESPLDEAERTARGEKILNYHPAFEGGLIGLRLMQADMLILYPDAADLAKQDGTLLLGAGETPPDVAANLDRLGKVQRFSASLPGGPFRSYVICDHEVNITFAPAAGRLELTGTPVWYCWKNKTDNPERLRGINDEANRIANARLREESKTASWTDAEHRRRFEKFFDEATSKALLEPMPAYSRELSAKIRQLDGINPAIYQAMLNTMRYGAVFRHAKKTNPGEWQRFLDSLRDVTVSPAVQTPTVLILPPEYRRR